MGTDVVLDAIALVRICVRLSEQGTTPFETITYSTDVLANTPDGVADFGVNYLVIYALST